MAQGLKGRGMRERVLRLLGCGDLYDRLHAQAAALAASGRAPLAPGQQEIVIDYPVAPRVRHGWGRPSEPVLRARMEAESPRYRAQLEAFLPFAPAMARITAAREAPGEPHWVQEWFPAMDAIALYGMVASRRPRRYVEIGSGNSTLFASRAIRDHGLPTRITSIDPAPRADVDQRCDEVIRTTLEEAPASVFDDVGAGDLVFFDGSHRAFQNSDVTVFFTEILPRLPAGTLVGVHDIFLPDDYPEAWLGRWYNEQYMLACWLHGGARLRIELPVHFASQEPALRGVLAPFWEIPALRQASIPGGAFWFSLT
ncbi:class I SAM-dependent methyltransferase [Rubritepida flocculans]|uniref:class I SAM-dependent methyltransferase n=1 Tax=Rubritepida flocculans TaxID=182403 RepID=UPI001B7FEAC7|nr:class I SAM-dependent methyltransferase [Rubritepida flocculans]